MSGPWEDYAPQQEAGPWTDYTPPAKKKTSQALGFYKGVIKPVDNAAMALEAGANALGVPTAAINNALHMPSAASAADQHENALARASSRPGAVGTIAGNIVGTIPAIAATKNPFILGGIQGAALTDKRNVEGVAADAAIGAGIGWAGGKVVDAAADLIKPVITPAVERLRAAGVKLTPGMAKGGKAMVAEDKRMSKPFVGDAIREARAATQDSFNTAAVNEALKPLGLKVPAPIRPGHDAVDYAKTQISNAYDQVIPNLAVKIDGQAFAQNIAPVARNLKPAEQKQLRQIISNEMGNGQLAGAELKRAQGEIRRLASVYSRSQNANEQLLGNALHAVDDELTGAMVAQNPKFAPVLQKINEAYRGYRIVADAASRATHGVINTAKLEQAVRRGDWSKNKDAVARGKGFMQEFSTDARDTIPAQYPDSGTAGRSAGIFANLTGAVDALGFQTDVLLQTFKAAPRPAAATKVAGAVRRLRAPVAGSAVAATGQPRD